MLKGMEFRIYPNRIQETIIQKTFGCSRVVYNSGLALRIEEYKNGNSIGYKETNSMLTTMKRTEEYSWLKEVDSIALQQSLRDLDKAYNVTTFSYKYSWIHLFDCRCFVSKQI